MLERVVDGCRLQVSEGGDMTKKEAWDSVEKLATHAIHHLDAEGRKYALRVVCAASDFLHFFDRGLPGES